MELRRRLCVLTRSPATHLALAFAIVLVGCGGLTDDADNPGDTPVSTDTSTPCTDATTCCPSSAQECLSDPDSKAICKCYGLWDCSQNEKKCVQPIPVPQGGTGWTCSWSASQYKCTGTSNGVPGAGAWTCSQSGAQWTCTRPVPNPTNSPAGVASWTCVVDAASGQLECTKPSTPSGSTGQTTPTEICDDNKDNDGDGKVDCLDEDCSGAPNCLVGPKINLATCGGGQSCVNGAVRWCDDGSCYWGKQICVAGTWGECTDTDDIPPACPAGSIMYDENCCIKSGYCCAHAVDAGGTFGSVGNCQNVDPQCYCTKICAPGAIRWCAVPDAYASTSYGGYGYDYMYSYLGGQWGAQTCESDGTWGPCQATTKRPGSCSGRAFDPDCCKSTGQCCQTFDSEDSDPQSVNCPASECDLRRIGDPTSQSSGGQSPNCPASQPTNGASCSTPVKCTYGSTVCACFLKSWHC